jgi:hypothetical protein
MNLMIIGIALLFYVSLTATFVVREFIRTKNGILRKIMIWYYVMEIYTYGGSGVFFILFIKNVIPMIWLNMGIFLIVIVVPKVIVKHWLLWYLTKGRKQLKF